MQSADGFHAASEYLSRLRGAGASVHLARIVLERTDVPAGTLMQALLLLRDAGLRHWDALPQEEQRGLREWCLFRAAALASASDASAAASGRQSPLLGQLLVVVAVFWKRAWLAETEDQRSALLTRIAQLFASTDRGHRLLAARLAGALVQEIGLSTGSGGAGDGGRAASRFTALGLPLAFHADTAASFQTVALLPLFRAVCEQLLAAAGPLAGADAAAAAAAGAGGSVVAADWPLLQALLTTLCDCLGWDFAGSRRGAALFRSSGAPRGATTALGTPVLIRLPASWELCLAGEAGLALTRAVAAAYTGCRAACAGSGATAETALQARVALAYLAAIAPTAASSAPAMGIGMGMGLGMPPHLAVVGELATTLAVLLKAPLIASAPASLVAGALPQRIGEEDAWSAAYSEARDLAVLASTLLGAHSPSDLAAAGFASSLLQPLLLAAFELTQRCTSSLLATARLVHDAAAAAAGDAARLAAAGEAVSTFLDTGRAQCLFEALAACLDLWKTVCGALSSEAEAAAAAAAGVPAPAISIGDGSGAAAAPSAEVASLVASVRSAVASLFDSLVRSRVALETAIVRAEIDNDDPLEDASAAEAAEEALAALARFAPAEAAASLLAQLGEAFTQLQSAVAAAAAAGKGAGADLDAAGAAACEALWWLVGHAAHMLADDYTEQVPTVPPALNLLSKATYRRMQAAAAGAGAVSADSGAALVPKAVAIAADPVVQLTGAVLSVCHYEASRVAAASAAGSAPAAASPFLYSRLLWAAGRIAATYFMPDLSLYTGAAGALAPVLSVAFAVDASEQAALHAAAGAASSAAAAVVTSAGLVSAAAALAPGAPAPPPLPGYSPNGLFVTPVLPDASALQGGAAAGAAAGAGSVAGAGGSSGGRPLLELVLHAAAAVLTSAWVATEPAVADRAAGLLRVIAFSSGLSRWAVMSPTWAALAAATAAVAGGNEPAGILAQPGAPIDAWVASRVPCSPPQLARFGSAPPSVQRALLAALLAATRRVGSEVPLPAPASSDPDDESLAGGGSSGPITDPIRALDLLQSQVHGSPPPSAADGRHPHPLALVVLLRWRAYYTALTGPAAARLAAVLASAEFARGSASPVAAREVERLLLLHAAVLEGHDQRLPMAWHIPATAPALLACAAVVRASGATVSGSGVGAALGYMKEFVQPEHSPLASLTPSQAELVFGAMTDVFRAYSAAHAGKLAAIAPQPPSAAAGGAAGAAGGAGTGAGDAKAAAKPKGDLKPRLAAAARAAGGGVVAASTGSSVRLSSLAEDELCDDVASLLAVLEGILSVEDVLFLASPAAAGGAGAGAGAGAVAEPESDERRIARAASTSIVAGLTFVIPVMSGALLQVPPLARSFLRVINGLVQGHPQQAAALDSGTFGAVVSALEFACRSAAGSGSGSGDGELASEGLSGVRGLASYHAACGRDGFARLPGLRAHVAADPSLWSRLLAAVLGAVVGPAPPASNLVPAAADALLSLLEADADAFQAAVRALLVAQQTWDAAAAERLATEFQALTSANKVAELHARARADPRMRRMLKTAFGSNVDAFVRNVRGFTTIE